MCGIAGIVYRERRLLDPGQLDLMKETLRHRGPDGEGMHIEAHAGLAMRRLSIIDIDRGQQPFFSEDRRVCVVFNGEIYNFRQLRNSLVSEGHFFSSDSDGEVIVHLWEELQEELVTRLNGMFAIALFDFRRNVLFLARDAFGIKPLYYYWNEQCLVFGSEIKALLASGEVPRKLDLDALVEFVSWEYVPAPHTLFRSLQKLEPGSFVKLDQKSWSIVRRRWWEMPLADPQSRQDSEDDWERRIGEKLKEVVRSQMVSDVPLGAFLSGGVDSSLVAAFMGRVPAFSIGFDDPSYDETAWAKKVAEHLDLSHFVRIFQPAGVDWFDRLMPYMDDPIADFSILPTFLISRLARERVTVALSGDGGDEIFGGYETYVAQEIARAWQKLPLGRVGSAAEEWILRWRPRPQKKGFVNKSRRFMEGLQQDATLRHARWRMFLSDQMRRQLFTKEAQANCSRQPTEHILRLFEESDGRRGIDQRLYVDLRSYLSDNCLVKVDRMAMACSLEVRVPLLDAELVEMAFQMPSKLKVRGWKTKILLKRLAARHVPPACVFRPKEGFSIPMKESLRREFRPLLEDFLSSARIRDDGIFQPETVETLKREHLIGKANHSHLLWALLVFHDWKRRWGV